MKLENFTDLQTWAVEQWGDTELGDSRRIDRAIAIGAAIAANPQASLPDMMQGWNEIRAAYRLFAFIRCNSYCINSTSHHCDETERD